tara:strand:+ start:1420 stop:1959 length:540 start_codon:yes stop_codon:yes gene_type:complete
VAKKKLSKEERLAKKLWPKQVTLPEGKEIGTILAKLFKEGYGGREGRNFYKKYIVDRVKDKQTERKIGDRARSTPDAEQLPTKKEVFESRLDFDRRRVAKERGEQPSPLSKLGDTALKVLRHGQRKHVEDPTGPDRDISPKEGDFNKGGVVKRKTKRKKNPTVAKKTYSRGSRKAKYNG